MELNGFMIGPEIKTLIKSKVGAVIAEHPVDSNYLNIDLETPNYLLGFQVPTVSLRVQSAPCKKRI